MNSMFCDWARANTRRRPLHDALRDGSCVTEWRAGSNWYGGASRPYATAGAWWNSGSAAWQQMLAGGYFCFLSILITHTNQSYSCSTMDLAHTTMAFSLKAAWALLSKWYVLFYFQPMPASFTNFRLGRMGMFSEQTAATNTNTNAQHLAHGKPRWLPTVSHHLPKRQ